MTIIWTIIFILVFFTNAIAAGALAIQTALPFFLGRTNSITAVSAVPGTTIKILSAFTLIIAAYGRAIYRTILRIFTARADTIAADRSIAIPRT